MQPRLTVQHRAAAAKKGRDERRRGATEALLLEKENEAKRGERKTDEEDVPAWMKRARAAEKTAPVELRRLGHYELPVLRLLPGLLGQITTVVARPCTERSGNCLWPAACLTHGLQVPNKIQLRCSWNLVKCSWSLRSSQHPANIQAATEKIQLGFYSGNRGRENLNLAFVQFPRSALAASLCSDGELK